MSIGFSCTQQNAKVILNHYLQPPFTDSAHRNQLQHTSRPSSHRLCPFAYASPERPPRNCHGPRGSPARNCWGPPANGSQKKRKNTKKEQQKNISHLQSPQFIQFLGFNDPSCPLRPRCSDAAVTGLLHARAAAAHLGEGRCAARGHRGAAGGGRPRRRVFGRRGLARHRLQRGEGDPGDGAGKKSHRNGRYGLKMVENKRGMRY